MEVHEAHAVVKLMCRGWRRSQMFVTGNTQLLCSFRPPPHSLITTLISCISMLMPHASLSSAGAPAPLHGSISECEMYENKCVGACSRAKT